MNLETKRDLARRPMRADFISEVESFDETTGMARIRMQPDPRRYDKVEQDGKTLYVDKYLRTAFSLGGVDKLVWVGTGGCSLGP